MHILIPEWFYSFDSAMYLADAFIGFLLSFYFHKIFTLSSEKKHMYLHLGFLVLSIGLLTLSITNAFTYFAYSACQVTGTLTYFAYGTCRASFPTCTLGLLDDAFSLEDFSYFAYFGLSILAYLLFLRAYSEEYLRYSRFFLPAFAGYLLMIIALITAKGGNILWYSYHEYFNLTALILLVFVSFKNLAHYVEMKSLNSLLVAVSFSFFALYHLCHLFSFIGGTYVLSHVFMLLGFIALLIMVIRVNQK